MQHLPQSLSLLILSIGLASSNAFLGLAPGGKYLVAPPCRNPASILSRSQSVASDSTSLYQSSDDNDDGSNSINIALITTSTSDDNNDKLQAVLKEHPFCKMAGIKLSIDDVPATLASDEAASWSKEQVTVLQNADIACFGTISAVKSYLRQLDDNVLNVPEDISEDDRRKLPNKPDLVSDIIGDIAEEGAVVTFMAACPTANAARECLNSGRWMSNNIYYPKDTQKAVELKTMPLEGDGEDEASAEEEEVEEELDIEVWADLVVQAAGDVMERKFWGGGW